MSYFTDNEERLETFLAIKSMVNHKTVYFGYNWDPIPPIILINQIKTRFITSLNCYLTGDGREIKYLRELGIYNYVYCPSGM
ncbi:MAG: hypothetical protein WCO05_05160, partial [Candidatus Moraniibacteriota bacterium]